MTSQTTCLQVRLTSSNFCLFIPIYYYLVTGFLSEDMTYSCAIFPELDGDLKEGGEYTQWNGQGLKRVSSKHSLPPSPPSSEPEEDQPDASEPNLLINETTPPYSSTFNSSSSSTDPLYHAQMLKLQHIINKLHIPPPTSSEEPIHILEIGTGWGALAIHLAEQFSHVEIDTITLSSQQKVLAEQRIKAKGLQSRIRVHLMDYRNMPLEWEGRFARFVSVEMIEAVGREFMEEYWRVVDWAMMKKGAVGVVQVISIPEASGSFNYFP